MVPPRTRPDGPRPLALVTGGHRRLGQAITEVLLAEGYRVAIQGRTKPAGLLEDTLWFDADLNDPETSAGLVDRVALECGTLPEVIVNSAARFASTDAEDWQTLADYHAVNAAAPELITLGLARRGGTGVVINLLDQRIRNPNRDQLAYTLAKTALAAATRVLAMRLSPGIRVNGVAPGFTLPVAHDHEQCERIRRAMPLQALATPRDIAAAVMFLVKARSVTGQIMFVDGGAHLRGYERDFDFF